MSRIRSLVLSSSLFAALAFAMIGGAGINSTMAAASGDAATSAPGGSSCIIAILKSPRVQQEYTVATSSDDGPGCGPTMRKAGKDQQQYAVVSSSDDGTGSSLTPRKAGKDQQEY
jgi:hypothetical protein